MERTQTIEERGAEGDKCPLCLLRWKARSGQHGRLFPVMEVDGREIRLCRHHADLFTAGTDEDRKEINRILAPLIYPGGLRTNDRSEDLR